MRVLFIGGGTLGSVTPLLAVAEALRSKGAHPHSLPTPRKGGGEQEGEGELQQCRMPNTEYRILFWGTRQGPERALVEAAGIPFRPIPSGKLRRYWDFRNLFDPFVIAWVFVVALTRFVRERPSVVVGAGSFVQVPVMWAAALLHIPILIHQLDVRPSLANRLVAPFARSITVTFPQSIRAFRRAEVIGCPVRRAILAVRDLDPRAAKRHFGFTGDRPALLVLGGGTGSQAINELVLASLPSLIPYAEVIHVTGKGRNPTAGRDAHLESVDDRAGMVPPKFPKEILAGSEGGIAASERAGRASVLEVGARPQPSDSVSAHYRPFVLLTTDLPSAYAAADLVVSRAGIGTIAELATLGKPMVLVPMPDTHQEENAAALARAGAAEVWDQRSLTPERFAERIRELLQNEPLRLRLSSAATAMFPGDAAARFASVILELGDQEGTAFARR